MINCPERAAANHRIASADFFENRLIFGDNPPGFNSPEFEGIGNEGSLII